MYIYVYIYVYIYIHGSIIPWYSSTNRGCLAATALNEPWALGALL